jgi:hypothetical protein
VYQFPFAVMLDEMDAIIAIPKDPVYWFTEHFITTAMNDSRSMILDDTDTIDVDPKNALYQFRTIWFKG